MYTIKTNHCFDSAHFLSGYEGKCSNIHGHRWTVEAEVYSDQLEHFGQTRGMVLDFGTLKKDLRQAVDFFDHALIVETDTLKKELFELLTEEGFRVLEVSFRPTAEEFAGYFYKLLQGLNYQVKQVTVAETPNNIACYGEERHE